jgi:hypothetical protein
LCPSRYKATGSCFTITKICEIILKLVKFYILSPQLRKSLVSDNKYGAKANLLHVSPKVTLGFAICGTPSTEFKSKEKLTNFSENLNQSVNSPST